MNERRSLTAAVQTAIELFLASVGFMPAGPRLLSYMGRIAGLFFLRRKAAEEKKGLGADRRSHAL